MSKKSLHSDWISKLDPNDRDDFRLENNQIFCEPCSLMYSFKQLGELRQHIKTKSHQNRKQKSTTKQTLLSDFQPKSKNTFNEDLCRALLAADIPWFKLSNHEFRAFLEKYTGKSIPDESTLRKNYLSCIYNEKLEKIRVDIGQSPIWLSVDETTDAEGRYIANVIVGKLSKDEPGKPHLLMVKQLEKTNNATVTRLIMDALALLWPSTKQEEINKRFLLLLTDSAAYMLKTGKNLKKLYKNMLHITCLAHAIHRVAEEVRSQFPKVNKLIGYIKKIFRKAPSRVVEYKKADKDMPLPPQPIHTRWGTWIEAVQFYSENFEKVKSVINSFDADEAVSIKKAQKFLAAPEIHQQIVYISAHFGFLAETITVLELSRLSLVNSLGFFTKAKTLVEKVVGPKVKPIIAKFDAVIARNPDFETLFKISEVLQGNESDPNIAMENIPFFKFAPTTSVDVERSFSMFKSLLSDRRRRMTVDNIEMMLICHYEQ